jgi:threonine/homoserine/homoserine lactone efflux protein
MRQAIGDILPMAIGAAISPIPIIGVVLMLVTSRARTNGPTFIVGWLLGLAIVGAIGLTVAGAAGASDDGSSSDGADTFQIVLGGILIVLALRQWRSRPKAGEDTPMPKWMASVDDFTALKSAGLGVVLSAVNPKNLILALAAATTIATTDISGADQVIAYAIFSAIATLGVAIPVVIYFAMGEKAGPILEDVKTWLAHHNAAIMAVIFLVIGAKILGQGIAG